MYHFWERSVTFFVARETNGEILIWNCQWGTYKAKNVWTFGKNRSQLPKTTLEGRKMVKHAPSSTRIHKFGNFVGLLIRQIALLCLFSSFLFTWALRNCFGTLRFTKRVVQPKNNNTKQGSFLVSWVWWQSEKFTNCKWNFGCTVQTYRSFVLVPRRENFWQLSQSG